MFNNPFDINHDGKMDLGERWLEYKAFEYCTKENRDKFKDDSVDVDSDNKMVKNRDRKGESLINTKYKRQK